MAFWSDEGFREPLKQNRWFLRLYDVNNDFLVDSYSLKECSKPSYEISVQKHKILNNTYNYPGLLTWKPITIKFVSVETDYPEVREIPPDRAAFESKPPSPYASPGRTVTLPSKELSDSVLHNLYFKKISTFNKQRGIAKDNLVFNSINIIQVDEEGKVIQNWDLKNAFFSNVEYGSLSYENDNLVEITCTVTYDWAELSNKDYFDPADLLAAKKRAQEEAAEEKKENEEAEKSIYDSYAPERAEQKRAEADAAKEAVGPAKEEAEQKRAEAEEARKTANEIAERDRENIQKEEGEAQEARYQARQAEAQAEEAIRKEEQAKGAADVAAKEVQEKEEKLNRAIESEDEQEIAQAEYELEVAKDEAQEANKVAARASEESEIAGEKFGNAEVEAQKQEDEALEAAKESTNASIKASQVEAEANKTEIEARTAEIEAARTQKEAENAQQESDRIKIERGEMEPPAQAEPAVPVQTEPAVPVQTEPNQSIAQVTRTGDEDTKTESDIAEAAQREYQREQDLAEEEYRKQQEYKESLLAARQEVENEYKKVFEEESGQ